tara:strand:+ start:642 stop:1493 length:852 start_codon:yes stop_codon:yes gene_type:complete
MNKFSTETGFTLPEVLIALAISSIIMIGVFGSYLMFNNTYYFQRDLTEQSNIARNLIDIMARDIRMTGYSVINTSGQNSIIAEPVVVIEPTAGDANSIQDILPADCGETIRIQYDKIDTLINGNIVSVRVEVDYGAELHNAVPLRCRLFRTTRHYSIPYLSNTANINHNIDGATNVVTEILADYIYDLSFELLDGNHNHIAGRKYFNNPDIAEGAKNYLNASCTSAIDQQNSCTSQYVTDPQIVDIYLKLIAPRENPTLKNNPAYGRRYAYDVSTTIKLRNVK